MPNRRNEIRLRTAAERLADGDVHSACCLCQLILVTEPDDPDVLCLMGEVGLRIGAVGAARTFLDRAGVQGNQRAAELLTASERLPADALPAAKDDTPRFLVIKSWGYGFWSDMSHVLGALLLAEITGREPVIHLGAVNRFGGSATRDAFTLYFEPVSPWTLKDVALIDPAQRYPAKWRSKYISTEVLSRHNPEPPALPLFFIQAQERVAVTDEYAGVPTLVSWIPPDHRLAGQSSEEVFRDLLTRYLRPNAAMKALVDQFHDDHLRQTPYVAVHLRGTDKQGEFDAHGHLNELIMQIAEDVPSDRNIFLMTDNTRWLERFRARFGDRVIVPEATREDGSSKDHFNVRGVGDPHLNGIEVLRDIMLALRAESFIGSGITNVAAIVALMRRWPPGTCTLVSAPYPLQPMPYFYLAPEFKAGHPPLTADEFVELSDA